jgi:hypothetical protein
MSLPLWRRFNISYSLFAGAAAFVVWTVIDTYFIQWRSPHRDTDESALALGIIALIATGIGSYIAQKNNKSDHGYIAALWASVFIGVLTGCAAQTGSILQSNHSGLPYAIGTILISIGGSVVMGFYAFAFACPFCLLGTTVFNSLLHLFRRT